LKIRILARVIAFLLLVYSVNSTAEIEISGYASIVGGKVMSGTEFLADYPKAGSYDNDWSFTPDSSIGLQISSQLDDYLKFTAQLSANGAIDFEPQIDWAYANYQLLPELSLHAGRKRLPLNYYSDFFDLGYAYYWIRPPVDNYTWQISSFNGVSLIYEPATSQWDSLFNFYVGREDSNENELLSMLFDESVDETWKNIIGLVGEFSHSWIELRFSLMNSQLDRYRNDIEVSHDVKQRFSGISINLYPNNLILLSEYNIYRRTADDIEVKTHMLSLGYKYKQWTPHLTRSGLKQSLTSAGGDEEHYTNSLGVRWDFRTNIALKIQFDEVTDKGSVIQIKGDSKSFSIGLDMVF